MKRKEISAVITGLLVATTFELLSVDTAVAVSLIGLDSSNNLVLFDSSTPGTTSSIAVTGIDGNLQGIDFRPANKRLYGVTDTNSIYTINTSTGSATFVSTLSTNFNAGFQSGIDFNPVPDRLRTVGSNGQNLRTNVDTGVVLTDSSLAYSSEDSNSGISPNITAAAYSNSFAGATTTTLYGIDYALDVLVTQDPPNAGTLNTVGSLGINFKPTGGFDIFSPTNGVNTAFAADSTLYSIDLNTGAASYLGAIGGGSSLIGLAATPVPEPSTVTGSLLLAGFGILALRNRCRRFKLPD